MSRASFRIHTMTRLVGHVVRHRLQEACTLLELAGVLRVLIVSQPLSFVDSLVASSRQTISPNGIRWKLMLIDERWLRRRSSNGEVSLGRETTDYTRDIIRSSRIILFVAFSRLRFYLVIRSQQVRSISIKFYHFLKSIVEVWEWAITKYTCIKMQIYYNYASSLVLCNIPQGNSSSLSW